MTKKKKSDNTDPAPKRKPDSACTNEEMAAFKSKYDDLDVMVIINQVKYVNKALFTRNIYGNIAAHTRTGYGREEIDGIGYKLIKKLLAKEDQEGALRIFKILNDANCPESMKNRRFHLKTKSGKYLFVNAESKLLKPARDRKPGLMLTYITLLDDEILCDEKIMAEQQMNLYGDKYALFLKLTPRKKEICQWISKGLNSEQIGTKLFITKGTVDGHRSEIIEELGIKENEGESLGCFCCNISKLI